MSILRRVQRGAFASQVLAANLDAHDSQDRGFITDVVYGTLRWQIYLDACLKPFLKRPDKLPADVRNALRAGAYELLVRQTPPHAAVGEWVGVVKKAQPRLGGLTNAVLRRLEPAKGLPLAERYSVPNWLCQDWLELFGPQVKAVAAGMLEPEPLFLSVYAKNAAAALEAEGSSATPGPLPGTLAVKPARALPMLQAFKDGFVQAQNPSSRLPVLALGEVGGVRVLDLASGNGVKAAQLAAAGAEVISVELSAKKVARAKANLKRLGLQVEHHVHDLTERLGLEPASKVLLDAPCSGTGTLRGHPEIKQRLRPEDITELAALQGKLLETAAALCEPGGSLVYAVCALTSAESLGVIGGFLKRHTDFRITPYAAPLPHTQKEQGTFILPIDGLDGFFISVLRRA